MGGMVVFRRKKDMIKFWIEISFFLLNVHFSFSMSNFFLQTGPQVAFFLGKLIRNVAYELLLFAQIRSKSNCLDSYP